MRPGWCAGALAVLAASQPCCAQPDGPQQFLFDNGFQSTPGLAFSFARGVETLDEWGGPVGVDEPRFAPPETLAGAPQIQQVRATAGAIPILGFGFDHDGVTPLMVVFQKSPPRLDIFTVAGDALLAAEAGGDGRVRTVLGGGGDLMKGTYPGRRFVPSSAVVACGLIVVLCDVIDRQPDAVWKETGVALVASQDQGHNWTLIYDDGPVQVGHKRAREWAMTNWWPMAPGPDPLEAWFAATDYRANPGANGGRAIVLRATRPQVGQPWVVESPNRLYEQLGPVGQHFHTAAVLPFGEQGMRALVSIGDGQAFNRIVSLTRGDRDYLSPDGWTINETYHGSMGTQGNQFCGAAPFAGGMLIGGDLGSEQIMRLECDPGSAHPTTMFVYGIGMANQGNSSSNFVIRTPTPNLPESPYISWSQSGLKLAGTKFARRVLYSPEGLQWMQAINPESATPPSVALHGTDIYFDRSDSPRGLFRSPLPEFLTRRPLKIGPGGLQRLVPIPQVLPNKGGTITALERSPEGEWLDSGVPIDPPPPCYGQVYRVRASRGAPTSLIGTIRPMGAAADFGNMLGTDHVITRMWARNLDPGKTARPRLMLRSSDKSVVKTEDLRISITDRWLPVTPTYPLPVAEGQRLEYVLSSGSPAPDDADFYLALDATIEGAGFSGYAGRPDTSFPPTGLALPDEIGAVSGLQCGPAWTVTLAGSLPYDGIDDTVESTTRWPLAAVWADQDNFARLVADTARRRLVIEIFAGGVKAGSIESTEIFWVRGSSVLVSMADAGDGSGIRASLSVGSLPVREATESLSWTTASMLGTPTEIRFGDGSGLSGDGQKVRQTPMLWWGGQIDGDRARSADERASLLRSLAFLTLPPGRPGCPADLDGDGRTTGLDLLAFQNFLIAGDAAADLDQSTGPGVLDALDFWAYLKLFEACP